MVTHIMNPSTQEAKVGGLQVQGQPELHRKFETNLTYLEKLCLKNITHE
jgi:hypothetical protein